MYPKILFVASLAVTAVAQAQSPQRFGAGHPVVGEVHSIGTATPPDPYHWVGSRVEQPLGHLPRALAPSSFRAEIRGAVAANASGDAAFGVTPATDRSPATFVVSLGVGSPRSAILFTRKNGTPLGVGLYRISEDANGPDEILALLLTGSTTHPTGVFRGQSGWLLVTAASDGLLTGRFRLDGEGFLAVEPQREDRRVDLTGSFAATPADSSF